MARRWYVARTKPAVEHAAMDQLRSDGFEAFMPCTRTLHVRKGRREVPLFPGYLFLRYDLEQEGSRPLRLVPQLRGLVVFDGVAPPVPDQVIRELAHRMEQTNAGQGLWRRPKPGDQMTVSIGSTQAIPALERALNDKVHFVRYEIASQLGVLGSRAGYGVLVKGLSDDNIRYRFKCFEALHAITGRTFDYSHNASPERRSVSLEKWNAWLEQVESEDL